MDKYLSNDDLQKLTIEFHSSFLIRNNNIINMSKNDFLDFKMKIIINSKNKITQYNEKLLYLTKLMIYNCDNKEHFRKYLKQPDNVLSIINKNLEKIKTGKYNNNLFIYKLRNLKTIKLIEYTYNLENLHCNYLVFFKDEFYILENIDEKYNKFVVELKNYNDTILYLFKRRILNYDENKYVFRDL